MLSPAVFRNSIRSSNRVGTIRHVCTPVSTPSEIHQSIHVPQPSRVRCVPGRTSLAHPRDAMPIEVGEVDSAVLGGGGAAGGASLVDPDFPERWSITGWYKDGLAESHSESAALSNLP
jgi:hypothetical protein